tara:strand:- start:594 stop:1328 length:735 start_codon:yes stop_codon:yes gene_type:complete
MTYSVILPTLNEKNHIIQLIKAISEVFKRNKKKFEIIVVDDCSDDGTIEILNENKDKMSFLKVFIRKGKKRNLANSINDGISNAIYENVIWMDADFQHNPEAINSFIDYSENYDFVICSRFVQGSSRYFDKIDDKTFNEPQSIFFNKICRLFLFKDLTDFTSGYTCIKKNIFEDYKLKGYYGEYFLDLIEYSKRKKLKLIEVPFNEKERASGKSKTDTLNLRYIIILLNYFLCFLKVLIKKYLL